MKLGSTGATGIATAAAAVLVLPLLFPSTALAAPTAGTAEPDAPYDYGFDVHAHLEKRGLGLAADSAEPYVVTGVVSKPRGRNKSASGKRAVYPRMEIRELQKHDDQWTLYVLALNLMQYTGQSQLLSYYQVAGIHGVPWVEWNGVAAKAGSENTGYCMHVSELFLTWHRPYLALYEQILSSLVRYIAGVYTDPAERARYQAAAARFRIPYMDWAAQPPAGESVLPESVGGSAFVRVQGPNGWQRISNPLYTYLFKPLNATMFIEEPYDTWVTTVRSPTAGNASAGSNNTAVSLALNQNFPSIQQRLYTLFSNYQNYSTFSNEAWIPMSSSGNYDSLESLHDTIHTLTGLEGHMAWIPFSAFDPIFFLHHAMVDRVFALWQVLNPDSYVLPTEAVLTSYTTTAGDIQDAQTPLTPFYKDANGAFWTSDDVRDMSVFGYTYDDMADFPPESLYTANATTQGQAGALINRLYGSNSPATLGILHSESSKAKRSTLPALTNASPLSAAPVVVDNAYREWVANVHVPKQALNGTFYVDLFLSDDGLPAGDPANWAYDTALVGTMSVFASPSGMQMMGMDMSGQHTSGTVPLTSALARLVTTGTLASLDADVVEPYLRTHLHCGVVTSRGEGVAPADVPGLAVSIVSSCVTVPATPEELPRWGAVLNHFDLI